MSANKNQTWTATLWIRDDRFTIVIHWCDVDSGSAHCRVITISGMSCGQASAWYSNFMQHSNSSNYASIIENSLATAEYQQQKYLNESALNLVKEAVSDALAAPEEWSRWLDATLDVDSYPSVHLPKPEPMSEIKNISATIPGTWIASLWTDQEDKKFSIVVDYAPGLQTTHRLITISGVAGDFSTAWYSQPMVAAIAKHDKQLCEQSLTSANYHQRYLPDSARALIWQAVAKSTDMKPAETLLLEGVLSWESTDPEPTFTKPLKITSTIKEGFEQWLAAEHPSEVTSLLVAYANGYWAGFDSAMEYLPSEIQSIAHLEAKNTSLPKPEPEPEPLPEPEPAKRASRVLRSGTDLDLSVPEDLQEPADSTEAFTPA